MKASIGGINLAYEERGSGTPLVLVHGYPLSRGAWRHQLDGLSGACRVIAPDLAGFGESDARPSPVSMDQFADDVHALLRHLGTGPVVLGGHSMGGYIVLAFARKYPAMLRGLVLVGTRSGPDSAEGAAGRRATAAKVELEGITGVVDTMAPKMIAKDKRDAAMVASIRELMVPSKRQGVVGALLGMAERPDATPSLASIAVPTLVITGTDDVLIPASESEKLAAAIPGAALSLIPAAGHLVGFEQPGSFNQSVTAWLAGIR